MALPDKNALIGPTVTEAQFKTNLGVIIDFVKPIELQSPSYSSTALLTATRPAESQSYAKALDTGKVWFWDKPAGSADGNYWKVTNLGDLDQAKTFANANPNFKAATLSGQIDFNTQIIPGQHKISNNDFNNATNKPPFNVGGILIVEGSGEDYFTRQRFCTVDNQEAVRTRTNVWSSWENVIKAGDIKAKPITSPIDFNTYKASGTYTITTAILLQCTNRPPVLSGGTFVVEGSGGEYLTTQRFRSYDNVDTSRTYKDVWVAWDTYVKSSDLKPKVVSSAIDFNAFNVPGVYSITDTVLATCANGPPTPRGGIFQNIGSGAGYYTHRIFVTWTGEFYYQPLGSTWGAWKKVATTDITDYLAQQIAAIQIPGTGLTGKKWAAIGDSITYGLNNTDNRSYANVLADRYSATLTKHAFSGAWISAGTGAVGPAPILSQSYTSLPNDADFDLITIAAGTNDRIDGVNGNLGTFADRTNETFYGALHVLIAGLKSKYPNARMLFISQIPRTGFRFTPTGATEDIDKKYKAIVDVCDYYGVPVWSGHKNFGFHPDDNATFRSERMPDGLHPSDKGQVWYANRLEHPILSAAK
ncbi:GDSL-type esterase/lipase family protein [Acinetobacter oleivorans]|uniref:GDSL-type esterase/lipase family protein n=1 Tax=Acinetobacter oleivorans TaxID=1148157 RepID=UPI003A87B769